MYGYMLVMVTSYVMVHMSHVVIVSYTLWHVAWYGISHGTYVWHMVFANVEQL